MAERHFNPAAMQNNRQADGVITLDQMIQFHAYFDSVKEPSPIVTAIKTQIETRLRTIFDSFNATPGVSH
jgi:hypothetical protein